MRGMKAIVGASAVAFLAAAPIASAAPINYGSFSGNTVVFQDIVEDSVTDPTPLYDTPSVVGDQLNFSPTSFGSFATGGDADITDGLLQGKVSAQQGYHLETFSFSEFGDYTLIGENGTNATSANIGQVFFVTITEVDGVALGANSFTLVGNSSFTSGGTFVLPDDAGIAQPWFGSGSIDLTAGLAAQKAEFPGLYGDFVTGIEFTSNNTLAATSESGTVAFIQKKDVSLEIVAVPEPASLSLLGLGATFLLRRRRI